MDREVSISIIMPIYNSENYLSMAIESVLKQSFKNFELILVDEGSSDQSGSICDDYALKDQRVRVVHKENGGICSSRNTGLELAVGKYVGFIDNDDVFDQDTLLDNYNLLEKNNADWIKFGKTEVLIGNQTILKKSSTKFSNGIYDHNEILSNLLHFRMQSMMTFVWDALFLRKNIIDNQLQFDPTFKHGNEDIDFCEQYAFYSTKLVVNSKCYYNHFTRIGISTSAKYSPDAIALSLYLLKKSNARYKYLTDLNILNYRTDTDYYANTTRQIIVPICQQLNNAGENLSQNEKYKKLEDIGLSEELSIYTNFSPNINVFKQNKKLGIYYYLFVKRKYNLLLLFDQYSRQVIYSLRKIMNSLKRYK